MKGVASSHFDTNAARRQHGLHILVVAQIARVNARLFWCACNEYCSSRFRIHYRGSDDHKETANKWREETSKGEKDQVKCRSDPRRPWSVETEYGRDESLGAARYCSGLEDSHEFVSKMDEHLYASTALGLARINQAWRRGSFRTGCQPQ
mmetsp:Transcript_5780/g.12182  ORF Transcript_5780/g.12182 Transcript_5780/m.12182 type:complete len:150 (-) Transcript_5780:855-1304(-)